MTPTKLALENISFAYGSTQVLQEFSLHIKDGDFIGLIGPNGSGKSTLLKLMGDIIKPDSGSIKLKGIETELISKKSFAQSVSWISQGHPMVFPFKVSEIILMGRHPYHSLFSFENQEDFKFSERAMKATMTSEFSDRFFNEISEGEKQRVMIASALAQDPELMLLDEPTSALDLKYQIQIMDILKELNTNNTMTLVVAMHDLNLASRFCNRIILINKGAVVSDGAPSEVLKKDILEDVYGVDLDLDFKNGYTRIHPMTGK